MKTNIQSIRGMNDIPPELTPLWRWVENQARDILDRYGYQEFRVPIVERTELFVRSIGEVTDIVEKEMYTFEDRNGDSLSLRPEATASMVRAAIQKNMLDQTRRLWCIGPMFRHERPQRGRARQFHQLDVEVFGLSGPDIDAELILLLARLWQELGIDNVRLDLNSLGNSKTQTIYRDILVQYFQDNKSVLDEDSLRRLATNPLRILDSKNTQLKKLIDEAPKLIDCLDGASKAHFDELLELLTVSNIQYYINPKLVRGLDYYTLTVFEWVTHELGAQGTICGGGRYNNLIEDIGGRPTPAIGFAMGLERIVELIQQQGSFSFNNNPHVYIIAMDNENRAIAFKTAETLRSAHPKLRFLIDTGDGKFKRKLKAADKSGALLAFILGTDEVAKNMISVKFLREDRPQETITIDAASRILIELGVQTRDASTA